MTPRMSALDPAGPQAHAIAWVWDVFYAVSITVWILVVAFTVAAAIRARRRREDDPSPARDRRHARAIIVAGALTVGTLVGLLVTSILASRSLAALEHDPHAVPIEITANQWWWQVTYYPDDPRQYAATANEIHVPVGRTVHLRLLSNDVIHSFWVPSIHGKRDLIPGRVNRTWIRVDEPGVYRGQCAEFCGLEHAKMGITVIAEPQLAFDAWLLAQRQDPPHPSGEKQRRGQQVFLGGPCVLCHSIAGTPAGGRLGPDLTHFASRSAIGANAAPNTEQNLRAWLRDPHGVKEGVRMPAIDLPPDDLDAVVAYLESLK